jgi:hypothetical protein
MIVFLKDVTMGSFEGRSRSGACGQEFLPGVVFGSWHIHVVLHVDRVQAESKSCEIHTTSLSFAVTLHWAVKHQ